MSTKTRQYWQYAEERWPTLQQFLGAYLHQDWPIVHGTPEAAVDKALVEYDLPSRMQVCREWWDWNATTGWKNDVLRAVNEGLGVNVHFPSDAEARQFMNSVYDKLIVSIRGEAGKDWKP